MYVKVKRKKTTLFLHIDLSETILEVKAKLEDLVQKVGASPCCMHGRNSPSVHACRCTPF